MGGRHDVPRNRACQCCCSETSPAAAKEGRLATGHSQLTRVSRHLSHVHTWGGGCEGQSTLSLCHAIENSGIVSAASLMRRNTALSGQRDSSSLVRPLKRKRRVSVEQHRQASQLGSRGRGYYLARPLLLIKYFCHFLAHRGRHDTNFQGSAPAPKDKKPGLRPQPPRKHKSKHPEKKRPSTQTDQGHSHGQTKAQHRE